jgi:hypothetical protein
MVRRRRRVILGLAPMHVGDVIADRFELLASAGSGGMGIVYRARDRQENCDVALKLLVERELRGLSDRFAQEVELLSGLDHPHIVGYVTHGTTADGHPYLVMPWLEGFDLQERLRSGPLSIDETLSLARNVASALACLHGRGLVHRDLKPSNLFLANGNVGDVKVIDLGIARATIPTRPMTMSGELLGTPGFIAPEQAQGDREIAPAVDIFALGCVLFECVTGKRLFTGAHVMAVLAKILIQDPPRLQELRADVPDALDLLVRRMVSKDAERRPRDGAELLRWLGDLGNVRSSGPPGSLTAREQRVQSLLVVILPHARPSLRPGPDATRLASNPLLAASQRFAVRVHALADRVALVVAPSGLTAADQASVLARFGRYAVETFPAASVALATGSALAGNQQPVGEAIDRGVTMARAAAPGEGVHVDDATAALITSRFDIKREGGRLVILDERLTLDPTRPLLGKPTPCVGRERELAILDATLTECEARSGPRVVLVTAPPGAGKSRLRHEFVRRLRARSEIPPRVLQSRGDPLHVATPYAQLAQAVRHAIEIREGEPEDSVRVKIKAHVRERIDPMNSERVVDFLGELVGATFDDEGRLPLRAARQNAAAMADQIRLAFESIARSWCRESPVILVLEDFHWGDDATVKLLDAALRKLQGEPLFVLALARPEVHERFPGLWRNRDVTELRLPPLPDRAATKLVVDVMGDRASPDDVAKIVHRSEGNAFYLEELIRAADERARRTSEAPASRRSELPPTVIAVAQSRLERLDPQMRKVLRAASVYGDTFPVEGVSALVGEPPADLERALDALVENEAIAPSESPARRDGVRELAFRHALLRGAAYATLTDEDRGLGHRLAAQWLEGVDEDREVVALHWLEGGDRKRAADRFTKAAETRWARAQADAAARCAVRALLVGALRDEGLEAVASRVKLLADALEVTRHIDTREVLTGLDRHVSLDTSARTVAHDVLDRLTQSMMGGTASTELPVLLAHAARAFGALSDFASARTALASAKAFAAEDAKQTRMIGFAEAKVAYLEGEWGTAVDVLSDTMLPEDPRQRLEMLLILATSIVSVEGNGGLPRGLDFVSRAEALLPELADGTKGHADSVVERARCSKARVMCLFFAGDYQQAARAAEQAIALAQKAGLRFEECAQLHNAGEFYIRVDEIDRARLSLAASSEIARDLGTELATRHNDVLLAYLDGRADLLEHLAHGAHESSHSWHELQARYWLGRLLAARKDDRARRELERAHDLARDLKVRYIVDYCTQALGALAP